MSAPDRQGRPSAVSAADLLTIAGMFTSVFGASQPWGIYTPAASVTATAVYVSHASHTINGFETGAGAFSAGWICVVAGVVCAALLLIAPTERERVFFLVVQVCLGSTVLALACYHVGPYLGVYLAIAGGLLLLAGGVIRYGNLRVES